jgi:predicted carbohydrate-binding protein with CBM5 and CBM33 domain
LHKLATDKESYHTVKKYHFFLTNKNFDEKPPPKRAEFETPTKENFIFRFLQSAQLKTLFQSIGAASHITYLRWYIGRAVRFTFDAIIGHFAGSLAQKIEKFFSPHIKNVKMLSVTKKLRYKNSMQHLCASSRFDLLHCIGMGGFVSV